MPTMDVVGLLIARLVPILPFPPFMRIVIILEGPHMTISTLLCMMMTRETTDQKICFRAKYNFH